MMDNLGDILISSLGIDIHTYVVGPWLRFEKSFQIPGLDSAVNMLQQYNSASSSIDPVS